MRTIPGTRPAPPSSTPPSVGPWSILRARISRTLHLAPWPTIDELACPLSPVEAAPATLLDAIQEQRLDHGASKARDPRNAEARKLALSIFGSVDHETARLFGAGGSLPRDLLDYFEPTARSLVMLRAICADMEPTDFQPADCA